MLGLEINSLAADMLIDWIKMKFGWEASICDEGPNGHLNPFHGAGPGKTFLPGCRRDRNGHLQIDLP